VAIRAAVSEDQEEVPRWVRGFMGLPSAFNEADAFLPQQDVEEGLRFRQLFDHVPTACVATDADGVVTESNLAADRLFAVRRDRFAGSRLAMFFPGQQIEHNVATLVRQAHGKMRWRALLTPREGPPVHVFLSAAVLGRKEGPNDLLWAIEEIGSEGPADARIRRETASQEQKLIQRLIAADEAKRAFLIAAGHDARSPLAAIMGMAELIRSGELSEQQKLTFLDRLIVNCRRLERLFDDLLDLDRLTEEDVAPHRLPTDVSELVKRVIAEREELRDWELGVDIAVASLLDVDPAMVERILENLLNYAMRHAPRGAHIWVWARSDEEGLLVCVEDDGPGFPDEVKQVIFEPYQQLRGGAAGIGLWIVTQLAELHGGRAWLEDRPGGGASFKVRLAA
jgi:signal transduction histidine kinase